MNTAMYNIHRLTPRRELSMAKPLARRVVIASRTTPSAFASPSLKVHFSQFKPSTIDSGFILSLPDLSNPATSDSAFQRILDWYLPPEVLSEIWPRLKRFGEEAVSPQVNEWISNAEREHPYVKTRNVWGGNYAYDRLATSYGWRELGKWGAKNG